MQEMLSLELFKNFQKTWKYIFEALKNSSQIQAIVGESSRDFT